MGREEAQELRKKLRQAVKEGKGHFHDIAKGIVASVLPNEKVPNPLSIGVMSID